jgi:hypothetical protein
MAAEVEAEASITARWWMLVIDNEPGQLCLFTRRETDPAGPLCLFTVSIRHAHDSDQRLQPQLT